MYVVRSRISWVAQPTVAADAHQTVDRTVYCLILTGENPRLGIAVITISDSLCGCREAFQDGHVRTAQSLRAKAAELAKTTAMLDQTLSECNDLKANSVPRSKLAQAMQEAQAAKQVLIVHF